MLILLALLFFPQDGATEAKELVDRLRSDGIEERELAARRLKELGEAARGALEKASRDPDSEVAERARTVLRVIEIRAKLSAALLKGQPGLEERLAGGAPRAWTEAFLKLARNTSAQKSDLEILAGPALKAAKPEERLTIISFLGSLQLESSVPLLLPFLRDADLNLSTRAAWSLCALKSEPARAAVRELFTDKNPVLRGLICKTTGTSKQAVYEPQIAALLSDSDAEVRRSAVESLRSLNARHRTAEFLALLRDPAPRVRRSAAEILGDFDCRDQIPAILPLLADKDEGVREIVLLTLSLLQARQAAPKMAALLADPQEEVQTAAAWALLLMNCPETATAMLPLLQSKEYESRSVAAVALGRFRSKEAVPALTRLLADDEEEVRAAAAWALGALQAREAAPALQKLLDDADREVRSAACGALAQLGVREALPGLLKQATEPKNRYRSASLTAIERLASKEALPELMTLLGSSVEELQEEAAAALRGIPAADVLPALRRLAATPDSNVRAGAARGFRALRSPEAKEDLAALLKDSDEEVRGLAAEALGAVGARDRLPELMEALKEGKRDLRPGAARAMGWLGAREAGPFLRELARDGSKEEELAAVWALEQMGDTDCFKDLLPHLEGMRTDAAVSLASWMCRQGRREGVPALLQENERLTALNALRQPAAWKKLEAATLQGDPEGTWLELADRIARDAGLRIEWRHEYARVDSSWLLERRRLRSPTGTMSAARALEQLVDLTQSDYDAVLEGDVLRFIPQSDASAFWKAWWETEQKRK